MKKVQQLCFTGYTEKNKNTFTRFSLMIAKLFSKYPKENTLTT